MASFPKQPCSLAHKAVAKAKKSIKKVAKKVVKKVAKKTTKKAAKKVVRETSFQGPCCGECEKGCCEGKLIGRITHYFSNIEVAVIDLTAPLKDGDTIRVIGGQDTDFEQEAKSMQIDHKEVKLAKKGDSVGMKVDKKVHEGYKVYKI